jgi:hypothetical protein
MGILLGDRTKSTASREKIHKPETTAEIELAESPDWPCDQLTGTRLIDRG